MSQNKWLFYLTLSRSVHFITKGWTKECSWTFMGPWFPVRVWKPLWIIFKKSFIRGSLGAQSWGINNLLSLHSCSTGIIGLVVFLLYFIYIFFFFYLKTNSHSGKWSYISPSFNIFFKVGCKDEDKSRTLRSRYFFGEWDIGASGSNLSNLRLH